MRELIAGMAVSVLISASGLAQSVRGTIVDDVRQLPIRDASVSLVRSDGTELPAVRSDSVGRFTVHAGIAETYRVKSVKLGYSPASSEPLSLQQGALVIVRVTMTQRAQTLAPVRVVEQRKLSVAEQMSRVGFDLRNAKGQGNFIDSAKLASFNRESAAEILRTYMPGVIMIVDTGMGPVIAVRQPGGRACPTTVFLDANKLHPASAYAALSGVTADQLYGIEVYRANEVPPPSLGAFLQPGENETPAGPTVDLMGRADTLRGCVIAVWTKSGGGAITASRGPGQSGIQVVKGTVVDFETGRPVRGIPVHLLTEADWPLGAEVASDSLGEFTIRTTRVGRVKFRIDRGGRDVMGPVFELSPEELLITRLYVWNKPVESPMAIAARVLPEALGPTNPTSFAYRRERGLGGTFVGPADALLYGASTVEQLLPHVPGIVVDSSGVFMRRRGSAQTCAAVLLLDGVRVAATDTTARRLAATTMLGIEIYFAPAEVPFEYRDPTDGCGMIGIWNRPVRKR